MRSGLAKFDDRMRALNGRFGATTPGELIAQAPTSEEATAAPPRLCQRKRLEGRPMRSSGKSAIVRGADSFPRFP